MRGRLKLTCDVVLKIDIDLFDLMEHIAVEKAERQKWIHVSDHQGLGQMTNLGYF